MRCHAKRVASRVFAGCLLIGCLACESESVQRSSSRGAASKAAGGGAKAGEVVASAPKALVFKDDDFVESERNRDPFRKYPSALGVRAGESVTADVQRAVIMPNTPVEAMRLIAIISGLPRPKAMLTDASSVGYVVERGDYIGSPKVVQSPGNVAMTLNWRVDRIRENEVVLTRQDPTDPTRPPLSRVIELNGP